MEKVHFISYDGSFKGFLSAVYAALTRRIAVSGIGPVDCFESGDLFERKIYIPTSEDNAQKLWDALGRLGIDIQRYVYYSFQSERIEIQHDIYLYVNLMLRNKEDNYWDQCFQLRERLSPWAQRVGKEKQHLEASMRFRLMENGLNYTDITPVFNVLPLLSKYCRHRFRDEEWLIHDKNRNLILYNQQYRVVLTRADESSGENFPDFQGKENSLKIDDQVADTAINSRLELDEKNPVNDMYAAQSREGLVRTAV